MKRLLGGALVLLASNVAGWWLLVRALDPSLPLGVHGLRLWHATLPGWVAAGVLLALVGEAREGPRLRLGRALFALFVLLSPPVTGALCGAVRWYQTARLAARFEQARAVPATVVGVLRRERTVEDERTRRRTTVATHLLQVEYTVDRPRTLEVPTDEETAAGATRRLHAAGVERASYPHGHVAWVLPDAPEHALLGPADARPAYPVSGVVPTLLSLALTAALVRAWRRERTRSAARASGAAGV